MPTLDDAIEVLSAIPVDRWVMTSLEQFTDEQGRCCPVTHLARAFGRIPAGDCQDVFSVALSLNVAWESIDHLTHVYDSGRSRREGKDRVLRELRRLRDDRTPFFLSPELWDEFFGQPVGCQKGDDR